MDFYALKQRKEAKYKVNQVYGIIEEDKERRVARQRRTVNTFQEGVKIKLPPFTRTRWYNKITQSYTHKQAGP